MVPLAIPPPGKPVPHYHTTVMHEIQYNLIQFVYNDFEIAYKDTYSLSDMKKRNAFVRIITLILS